MSVNEYPQQVLTSFSVCSRAGKICQHSPCMKRTAERGNWMRLRRLRPSCRLVSRTRQ